MQKHSINILILYKKLTYYFFVVHLKAYVLLGQFLVLKKDEELFKEWLKENCNANANQGNSCYTCLKEWCNSYI